MGRRQKVFLVGLVAVNLLIYGALAMFFLGQRRTPRRVRPDATTGGKLELQVAYEKAEKSASRWQPDAQLVGVTTWWHLSGNDALTLYRPAWSFSFYSPATHEVQVVKVDREGAQAVRESRVGVAPAPVEADWAFDSNDLLLTFMAYGGEDFLGEHASANIHFRLSGQEGGRSIWYLSAIDPVSRQSFTLSVDALSREVVSTN
jgi:hypothetical protein